MSLLWREPAIRKLSETLDDAQAANKPILIVIAGSNGAGKTTFYREVLSGTGLRFVNADEIARLEAGAYLKPTDAGGAYAAMQKAEAIRQAMISLGESFAMETVLSDPKGAKLGFFRQAQAAGYCFIFVYITLENAQLSMARVAQRVAAGGHDVPDEKLISRFRRTQKNARKALTFADFAMVLDNNSLELPYRLAEVWKKGKKLEGLSWGTGSKKSAD